MVCIPFRLVARSQHQPAAKRQQAQLGRQLCHTNPAKLNDPHQLVQPWPSSFSQAAGHAMALSRWVAGQKPTTDTHKAHATTREWRDAEIDKVVDHRAGLADKQRDNRNFSKIR